MCLAATVGLLIGLVIAGSMDRATTPDQAMFIAERIPQARLTMLEAAHLSNVEQPEGPMPRPSTHHEWRRNMDADR